ncbi:MAG: hypothetical protein JXX28_11940 [Deltaproteobacteria bacterium]|nr:hypothetical protein [Deltaproteobacteria bacterium]
MRSLVVDGAQLVDAEVRKKSGISGAAVRAGYKTMVKIKPGIVEEAMGILLPGFAPAIDPFWEKARASGEPHRYFEEHATEIADALLGVTDRRAERAKHPVMKKLYRGLRGTALAQTASSVPSLSHLILRYDPL